jgi:hypothetical protein
MVINDAKVLQAIADEIERARTENRCLTPEKVIALVQAIEPTCDPDAIVSAMADIAVEKETAMITFRAENRSLRQDEASWVSRPAGTPLQELSPGALRVLAAHYIDTANWYPYSARYYGQCGGWATEFFALTRLATLAKVVGEDAFEALTAEKHAEWKQKWARAEEYLATLALAPCVTCGRSRGLDEIWGSPLCGSCAMKKWLREHPEFSTGGDGDPPLEDEDLPS